MNSLDLRSPVRILLTGAGFTHNFGAPLARGMWSKIFNSVALRNQPRLLDLLRGDFDFEFVYEKIVAGAFSLEEKNSIKAAVFEAFREIDSIICDMNPNVAGTNPYPVNMDAIRALISEFAGSNGIPGYIFTLNQDLFLERHYGTCNHRPVLPGIKWDRNPLWFVNKDIDRNVNGRIAVVPSSSSEVDAGILRDVAQNSLCYVKLLG